MDYPGKLRHNEGRVLSRPGTGLSIAGTRGSGAATLYYAAFAIYIAGFFLSITTFRAVLLVQSIKALSILFVAIKLLYQRYSPEKLAALFLLAVVGFMSWGTTRDVKIITLVLFVFAAEGVDVQVLAKIVFIEYLCMIIVTVFCAELGIIEAYNSVRLLTGKVRLSLGFTHPNRFGAMVAAVILAHAVKNYPRVTAGQVVLDVIGFAAVYYFCDSRSAMAVIASTPALALLSSIAVQNGLQKEMALVSAILFSAIVAISLYETIAFDGSVPWQRELNELVGYRMSWAHRYYLVYPPSAMGRSASAVSEAVGGVEGIFMIDNSYARLLLIYGVVPTALFIIGHLSRFRHSFINDRFTAADFGLIVYAIAGITEHNAMLIAMNFCLIALSPWHMDESPSPESLPEEGAIGSRQITALMVE